MDAAQGHTKTNQDQLLEIYKLHAQLANSASNRRTATNRFYQLVLSGVLLFFFTVGQQKDKVLPEELSNKLTPETLTTGLGCVGFVLSWIWFISIDTHLDAISRKYEVLKELEAKLDFPFITHEWKLLGKNKKNSTYRKLAFREVFVPYFSCSAFFALLSIGNSDALSTFYPVLIVAILMLTNITFRLNQ